MTVDMMSRRQLMFLALYLTNLQRRCSDEGTVGERDLLSQMNVAGASKKKEGPKLVHQQSQVAKWCSRCAYDKCLHRRVGC